VKYITLVCIALLSAAATAVWSQTASDTVEVSCALAACASGGENGVLLIAKTVQLKMPPSSQSSISVGTVNPAYGQVVAFRSDRAPAIQTPVTWTPHPKTISLNYPEVADVPVQVWVICADEACGPVTPSVTKDLNTFWSNSNVLLTDERAGMRITRSDGPAIWISDETQNAALTMFRDFTSDQCSDLNTMASAAGKKKAGAINMYLVRTVDNEPSNGYRCSVANIAVDGWATYWTTKLHELGHTMSLRDVNIGTDPDQNMMYHMPSNPATRRFFTEGQVFRMHFNVDSSLNSVFHLRDPLLQRDCGNTNAQAENAVPPCPPLTTLLWPEN
jgi:hypothetical protein